MKKILICAISKNRVLGKNNKLLWNIPEDLNHFKKITDGHTIIMGRKTFESLPKILPNRKHIVITRNKKFINENIETFSCIENALQKLKNEEKVFIIGGGEIYKYSLENNLIDEIELTLIDKEFEGDTFFPDLDDSWKITKIKELKTKDFILKFINYKKF